MKRLVLLRHAKSDWSADYRNDHERPLSKRGRKAAAAIGTFVAGAGLVPDVAITSSAVRARTTLALAMEAGEWKCQVDETARMYQASADDVIEIVQQVPNEDQTVLVVGHEPTWSGVAHLLTGAAVRMATATLVGVDFEFESWTSLRPGAGVLAFVIPPRLLTDG